MERRRRRSTATEKSFILISASALRKLVVNVGDGSQIRG